MNAMMNTEVAVKRVGIINTPNQPMYKRFSVEVTHSQKRPQRVAFSRVCNVAVIVFSKLLLKLVKKSFLDYFSNISFELFFVYFKRGTIAESYF